VIKLLNFPKQNWEEIDLNYSGENSSASFLPNNSNIHAYPAKLVPNLVHDIINNLKKNNEIKKVLDPFVGSGTVGLESKYLGLDFYGSDMNPLSILISRTKTLNIEDSPYVIKSLNAFTKSLEKQYEESNIVSCTCFKNIDYWFKKENIRQMSFIKNRLDIFLRTKSKKYQEIYSLILLTSFSSAIRKCSLTRNGEFKLYRMVQSDIDKFNPNAFEIFSKIVKQLLDMLNYTNQIYEKRTVSEITLQNAKSLNRIDDESIDLVFTSPPYGDSRTTVAYGQFSRLPLQWIGDLIKRYVKIDVYTDNCDEYLLGGKKSLIPNEREAIIKNSNTLRKLELQMITTINNDLNSLYQAKQQLLLILKKIKDRSLALEDIGNNNVILELIKERLRLNTIREINTKAKFTKKQAKIIALQEVSNFFDTFNSYKQKKYRKYRVLENIIPYLMDTINRKIKSMPKRVTEIMNFFLDLYMVIVETDKKLRVGGQQVWVVGHRTVLGEINVNMRDVLKDWFIYMGYIEVTSLQRKYSFKRMPNHITSTITRNEQIKTMMEEHILIVQKGIKGSINE
jgi:DNA modification methylase